MRFKKIIPTFAVIAIATIACSSSYAQLEMGSTISAPVQAPMVIQGAPLLAGSTADSVMQGVTQFNPQMMSNVQPIMGQPNTSAVVTPSNAYGPLTIAKGGSGCRCCDMTPTPAPVPTLEPVTSCCGSLGRHGIPSLLTPPRTYRPPIGRQYGRPLIGKWSGY